jgi:hypothetical protein
MSIQTQIDIRNGAQRLKESLTDLSSWIYETKNPKVKQGNDDTTETCAVTEKEAGNSLFKKRDYLGAVERYSKGINMISHTHRSGSKVLADLYLNRSLCYMHIKQFRLALKDSVAAHRIKPSVKSLYRKASAEAKLNNFSLARSDLAACKRLISEDDLSTVADCARLSDEIQAAEVAYQNAEAAEARWRLCTTIPEWCRNSEREDLIPVPIAGVQTNCVKLPLDPPIVYDRKNRYVPRSERMRRGTKVAHP